MWYKFSLMEHYTSLISPVIERASSDPDRLSLIFFEEGEYEEISAYQFHREASKFAAALERIKVEKGDLIVLVLQHSKTLLYAFWGAMFKGAVPSIFPFLTEKLDPIIYMERVKSLVAHEQVRIVITYPAFKAELEALLSDLDCKVLSTDEIGSQEGFSPSEDFGEEKLAFLQHSSGTTGLQKGVALSHRAVLNQIDSYAKAILLGKQDVIVSWLPLYHDMGLIAGFVMPIVTGTPLILISPFDWVRKPQILLHAISRYRGTLVWLPNFAYNHMARAIRPRHMEGVDLSSWRAAVNCSEPVQEHSHQVFLEQFQEYGFTQSKLAACYAMAENTFAVTQSKLGKAPRVEHIDIVHLQEDGKAFPAQPGRISQSFVSCGFPIDQVDLQIRDAEGNTLPERQAGEIALRSNSMLSEYYRRPDITEEAVRDGWYLTGDMGYLAEGELFITGRKKDMIIVGGKNVYPQDLEQIANQVPGIYPGRAVAFGVMDQRMGSEGIVMVCEINGLADESSMKEIEHDLRRRITASTEISLSDVRLVEGRWLIKTSSGKIARNDNREKYYQEFFSESKE